MRRLTLCLLLSVFGLLTSACSSFTGLVEFATVTASPLPPTPTPSPTSIALLSLDAQINLQSSQATATQAQREVIRATEQAAQVTAQWQATLDGHALDVTATADAIQLAIAAHNATAIAQSQVYSETIQRAHAQAAVTEAETARREAEIKIQTARAIGQIAMWSSGISLALMLIASIGIWLYWWWQRQKISSNAFHHERWARVAERQAEARQAIAEAIRVSIVEYGGQKYLPTDDGKLALLLPPPISNPPPVDKQPPTANRQSEHDLRAALKRLVYAGIERGGFSENKLMTPPAVVLNPADNSPYQSGLRVLLSLLTHPQVGVLSKAVGKETTWAEGWGLERFEREFDIVPLPLPYPDPLPIVRITLRTHVATRPRGHAPTSPDANRLIEGNQGVDVTVIAS